MPAPKIPTKKKPGSGVVCRYAAPFTVNPATAKRLDSNYYVEGYASTFDVPYELYNDGRGNVINEIVQRTALSGADMSDVIMQFDHAGAVMARQRNKSLIVEPDSHGLFVAADLSGSQQARDLYESIANGLIDRMSWSFIPTDIDFDDATSTQTIKNVSKVFDVSAVSLPADEDTEISARAALDGVIERRRLEQAERERLETQRRRVALLASMSI